MMRIDSVCRVFEISRGVFGGRTSRIVLVGMVLGYALLLSSAIYGEVSHLEVPGRYEGSYAGASILLSVFRKGTYQLKVDGQSTPDRKGKYPFGMSFSAQGSWDVDAGRIRFWNFANPADLFRQGFPTTHTYFDANFDKRSGTLRFASETNLFVRRSDPVKP